MNKEYYIINLVFFCIIINNKKFKCFIEFKNFNIKDIS